MLSVEAERAFYKFLRSSLEISYEIVIQVEIPRRISFRGTKDRSVPAPSASYAQALRSTYRLHSPLLGTIGRSTASCQTSGIDTKGDGAVGARKSIVTNGPQNWEKSADSQLILPPRAES